MNSKEIIARINEIDSLVLGLRDEIAELRDDIKSDPSQQSVTDWLGSAGTIVSDLDYAMIQARRANIATLED